MVEGIGMWHAYLVRAGIVFSKTNTLNSNHNMAYINLKCQHLVKNDVTFVRISASIAREVHICHTLHNPCRFACPKEILLYASSSAHIYDTA